MPPPFTKRILPENVRELIDFGMLDEAGESQYESMAALQTDGVAALYNILCKLDFAYLADEVGMGKTYQALGLAALLWNQNPNAKVVFLSPRLNLQNKWRRDYINFVSNNYRQSLGDTGDTVLKCMFHKKPLISPVICGNLQEFVKSLYLPGKNVWFLRHTSFRRPLFVNVQTEEDIRLAWQKCRQIMNDCGLYDYPRDVSGIKVDNASRKINLRFGKAVGSMLARLGNGKPAIDLLVVDEAQYLRHADNQGNSVLRAALTGNVAKWLFLSATPIHSGRTDVKTQINDYVHPDFITQDDIDAHAALVERMKQFTIRRPRKFVLPKHNRSIVKHEYREHIEEEATCGDVFGALSMALVQKQLVEVLAGRNNRFRIGFLSCFESLQDSLRGANLEIPKTEMPPSEDQDSRSDFYRIDAEPVTDDNRVAPDADFISRLAKQFEELTGESMPHPKMDHTVKLIGKRAFDNGEKFLIFCRRLSAVEELRKRLDVLYHRWIERRVEEQWNDTLNWETGPEGSSADEPDEPDAPIDDKEDEVFEGASPFRRAMARGGWLYKYVRTFRATGRNAMLFQENWFHTICSMTGAEPTRVIAEIPEEIWQEAVAAGTRIYAGKKVFRRRSCFQYLVKKLVDNQPRLLGLDRAGADTWQRFFDRIYQEHNRVPNMKLARDMERDWLLRAGFWEVWQQRFNRGPECILVTPETTVDELYRREIKKNWAWQSFRLTDTLIDIYLAEHAEDRLASDVPGFLNRFFDYLCGDTKYGVVLRGRVNSWFSQFDNIWMNAFKPENDQSDFGNMAAKGSYTELENPAAVVAVTGGSAVNETAIRQFKTPSYPQIIVCTDVLKEGEDLHLFCDQVVHYGVAWTSGDMEQRIGRVDRFFSQIERRLRTSDDPDQVKLNILYPFMGGTLEEHQIERVRNRAREAERILDNFNVDEHTDAKEMHIDEESSGPRMLQSDRALEAPFEDIRPHLPTTGSSVVRMGEAAAIKEHRAFVEGMKLITEKAESTGFIQNVRSWDPVTHDFAFDMVPQQGAVLHMRLELRFMNILKTYSLRFLQEISYDEYLECVSSDEFSFAYEVRRRQSINVYYRTHRLFLHTNPTPEHICRAFEHVVAYLRNKRIEIETDEDNLSKVKNILAATKDFPTCTWSKKHKANLVFQFEHRKQSVNLYVYKEMLLVVSRITSLGDIDDSHFSWAEDKRKAVQDWCLNRNATHTLGFLRLDRQDDLYYCSRLFTSNLETIDIQNILSAIAFRADMFEAFLTGEDVN